MPQIYTIDSYAQPPRKSVQIAVPPNRQQSENNSRASQSQQGGGTKACCPPLVHAIRAHFCPFLTSLQERLWCRQKKGAMMSIKEKIHPRYLEFEPLCCLSSCLARGGCYSVAVFEIFYVVLTSFVIALKIHDGGRMDFWDDFDAVNFNAIMTHQVSLYILVLFNFVTLGMAAALIYGLISFERVFVKMHWRFDFFSLAFNTVLFILYIFALSSEGPETWTWKNVLLVVSFATQIPLQIWAIFVVKSCYDFYVLLYVFVSLAEK